MDFSELDISDETRQEIQRLEDAAAAAEIAWFAANAARDEYTLKVVLKEMQARTLEKARKQLLGK